MKDSVILQFKNDYLFQGRTNEKEEKAWPCYHQSQGGQKETKVRKTDQALRKKCKTAETNRGMWGSTGTTWREKVCCLYLFCKSFNAEYCRQRLRKLPALSAEALEQRALLFKKWSAYKLQKHLNDVRMLDRIEFAQQRALDELKKESEELYQEAVQVCVY